MATHQSFIAFGASRGRFALACSLLLAAGCDAPRETPDAAIDLGASLMDATRADTPAPPQDVAVPGGGVVGTAGGEVTVGQTVLTVPPGALTQPTRITITRTGLPPPAGVRGASAVFRFEPAGLTFARFAVVQLPIETDVAAPAVYWTRPDGSWERLASTRVGRAMEARVSHFSMGLVGDEDDAGIDGGSDAELDGGSDAELDGGSDAELDAALDAERDAGPDAPTPDDLPTGMDAPATDGAPDAADASVTDAPRVDVDAGGCVPFATRCVGAMLETCNEDGRTVTLAACEPAFASACRDGHCTSRTQCTGGAETCRSETMRAVCSLDGTTLTDIPCAPGERCLRGRCLPACTPRSASCRDAGVAERCEGDGVTRTPLSCAPGSCASGLCSGWACAPETGTCATATALRLCNPDGRTTRVEECVRPPGAATVSCVAGACRFTCAPGRTDCNADLGGCEADLQTSVIDCGACGHGCVAPDHASPTCAAGVCGSVCVPGFTDCNGRADDGCEASLASDPSHCGTCGRACAAPAHSAASCRAGACASSCLPGFTDCNGRADDGCEAATASDDRNCGACGVTCPTGVVCRSGGCGATARPLAPQSFGRLTTRRPTFRWALSGGADGAHLDVCRDRACATSVLSRDVVGTQTTLTTDLPTGLLFWRLTARTGATGGAASATWEMLVPPRNAPVNTSAGHIFDVDGDGRVDLGLGEAVSPGGLRAVIYRGPVSVGARSRWQIESPDGGYFGSAMGNAGDLNGDGYSDLAVYAPECFANAGRAYVFLGGPSGPPSAPTTVLTPPPGAPIRFGEDPTGVGDVNGDGYSDLAVGQTRASRIYVYFGSAAGVSATVSQTLVSSGSGAGVDGFSFAGGDVNGDGYADLLGTSFAGGAEVWAFLGGPTGLISPAQIVTRGMARGFAPNTPFAAGDANGDGYTDAMLRGPYDSAGYFGYLVLGGPTGFADGPAVSVPLPPPEPGVQLGESLASADLNADGYADFVFGSRQGNALVVLGAPSGLMTPTSPFLASFVMRGLGDVTGDGIDDLGNAGNIYPGSTSGAPLSTYFSLGYRLYDVQSFACRAAPSRRTRS